MELDDAEATALARTKAVHVALLVLSVQGGVRSGDSLTAWFLPPLAFLLAGVAEAFVPGASAAQTAKRAGKTVVASILGIFGLFVLATASQQEGS